MRWILLSLLAPALYTCNNFIDKYVLERRVKNSHGLPVYSALAAFVIGTALWLAAGAPLLSRRNGLLLFASGVITVWALALYFYALAKNHTSYIIAVLQTTPLFTFVLSVFLLNEPLNGQQLGGFLLTVLAVVGLSAVGAGGKIGLDRAFYAIIAANVLLAVAAVIIKFAVGLEGLIPIVAYQAWGIAAGGALLFVLVKRIRQAFVQSMRSAGISTLAIMFGNEVLFNAATGVTYLAITLGPVALVNVLGGVQVFYGILFGIVLTRVSYRTFHEDMTRRALLKRIGFSAVLFVGVGLIGVGS